MAIYVPGVPSYMPNLKPFTPDYKFLSDVLTAKTNKYNTNYKAINDKYSQVVYADLSRTDTQELRDQYVNDLGAQLQKVSGMDLSVMQNVDAAKGLFRPFYEEDIIVRDLVWTRHTKQQNKLANDLRTSPIQEVRDTYWPEGIEAVNYKMQDFINSSEQEALQMKDMPSYVENPRLYKRAMDYFEAKDWKMKWDELSKDGAFIVTNQNGEDVTPIAMSDLRATFGKDPLIQQGYYTQSYVKARRYADKAMENGITSSIKEGMVQFNTDVIQKDILKTAAKVTLLQENLVSLKAQKEKIDKEYTNKTPAPGSPDDLAIKKLNMQIIGSEAAIEQYANSMGEATQLLETNDPALINARGYNIGLTANIEDDLQAAARHYTMQTMEKTFKVNSLEQQRRKQLHDAQMKKYDFSLVKLRDQLERERDEIKHGYKIDEIETKAKLDAAIAGAGSEWMNIIGGDRAEMGIRTLSPSPLMIEENVYEMQIKKLNENLDVLNDKAIDLYLGINKTPNNIVTWKGKEMSAKDFRNMIVADNEYIAVGEELKKYFNDKTNKDLGSITYTQNLKNYNRWQQEKNQYQLKRAKFDESSANANEQLLKIDPVLKNQQVSLYDENGQKLSKEEFIQQYMQAGLEGKAKINLRGGYNDYYLTSQLQEDGTYKNLGGKNIFKPSTDPVWAKLESGEITPFIKVKADKINGSKDSPARIKDADGYISIINPELIQRSNVTFGSRRMGVTNPEMTKFRQSIRDFISKYGGIQPGGDLSKFTGEYKEWFGIDREQTAVGIPSHPGDNALYLIDDQDAPTRQLAEEAYEYTYEALDKVAKNIYLEGTAHEGDANEVLTNITLPDMLSGKGKDTPIPLMTSDDIPNDIKNNVSLQIRAFKDALNNDRSQTKTLGANAYLDFSNMYQALSGNLDADKSEAIGEYNKFESMVFSGKNNPNQYSIIYNPYADLENGLASYTIQRNKEVNPTKKDPRTTAEIKAVTVFVPLKEDTNPLNPEREHWNLRIPSMVKSSENNSYSTEIPKGGKIIMNEDQGIWTLYSNGVNYNMLKDNFTETTMRNYSFNNEYDAQVKWDELENLLYKNSATNYKFQNTNQAGYNKYLQGKKPSTANWNKYIKSLQNQSY